MLDAVVCDMNESVRMEDVPKFEGQGEENGSQVFTRASMTHSYITIQGFTRKEYSMSNRSPCFVEQDCPLGVHGIPRPPGAAPTHAPV